MRTCVEAQCDAATLIVRLAAVSAEIEAQRGTRNRDYGRKDRRGQVLGIFNVDRVDSDEPDQREGGDEKQPSKYQGQLPARLLLGRFYVWLSALPEEACRRSSAQEDSGRNLRLGFLGHGLS